MMLLTLIETARQQQTLSFEGLYGEVSPWVQRELASLPVSQSGAFCYYLDVRLLVIILILFFFLDSSTLLTSTPNDLNESRQYAPICTTRDPSGNIEIRQLAD